MSSKESDVAFSDGTCLPWAGNGDSSTDLVFFEERWTVCVISGRIRQNNGPSAIPQMHDFLQCSRGGSMILLDPGVFPEPDTRLFSPDFWKRKGELVGSASGRGTTHFLKHKGEDLVLRHYHRGGFVSRFVSDGYVYTGLENTRPWREIALLYDLQTLGLPAPFPVGAMVTRYGVCYRADIITRKIPDSEDLFQILCRESLSTKSWRSVGETIRQFHDKQIFHHDLNIHNLMLDRSQTVWLIDFDKCGRKRGDSWKMKNLDRLRRSLNKENARQPGFHWTESDWNNLLAGYSSNSQQPPGLKTP